MTSPSSSPVAFVGGGNMARSLIGGLIARGTPPASICVSEPQRELREALAAQFGVRVNCSIRLPCTIRGSTRYPWA